MKQNHTDNNLDLSIIIVNWNTKKLLEDCLESVVTKFPKTISYEIIVVDNASKDGSGDMVKKEFPSVKLIQNTENCGFATANNQGSRIARGRILLLLNSDTVILDDKISKIIEYFDAHKDVGVVTGRVLNGDMTFQRPFYRFPGVLGVIVRHTGNLVKKYPTTFSKNFQLNHLDEMKEHEVGWVTGAYLFISRSCMDTHQVFDSDIFMYYEDTLLCHKIKKMGYRVMYLPYAPIIHYGEKSSKKVKSKAIYFSFNGSIVFVQKAYGKNTAYIYTKFVRVIWFIFVVIFTFLQWLPNPKFREKKILFKDLLFRFNDI